VHKFNGTPPKDGISMLTARKGEFCLDHKDIISYIEEFGDEIALILLSGIQYYTGQLFRMKEITLKAHEKVFITLSINQISFHFPFFCFFAFSLFLSLYLLIYLLIYSFFRIALLDGIWLMLLEMYH
jgi:hypothetical protein